MAAGRYFGSYRAIRPVERCRFPAFFGRAHRLAARISLAFAGRHRSRNPTTSTAHEPVSLRLTHRPSLIGTVEPRALPVRFDFVSGSTYA